MMTEATSASTNTGRILLIGDVRKAFSDAESISGLPLQAEPDVRAGIEAASGGSFSVIGIVAADLGEGLESSLRTLQKAGGGSKVVLLVQMFEEPAAMRLVGSEYGVKPLADDYLICPVTAERFCACAFSGGEQQISLAEERTKGTDQARIRQLEKLATEDDLTALKNRRYRWEFSRQIIERARKAGRPVTLLLFDIDNLKSYNDIYGHLAGDEILRQAARLMSRCCRAHDVVGRIGGDEFAAVFWDGPDAASGACESERRSVMAEHPKQAIVIAKRFQKALEKTEFPLLGPKGRGVLTISGGLATFPDNGSTVEELFEQADKALLDAKRSGKNKIYLVGKPRNDIANIE